MLVQSLKARSPFVDHLEAAEGEIALRQGDPTKAIRLLQKAVEVLSLNGTRDAHSVLPVESLAEAYRLRGDLREAVRVLELTTTEPQRRTIPIGPSAVFWMRAQAQLAGLYRRTGREDDARVIETELLKLLVYADSDYPLLVELKARQQARAADAGRRPSDITVARTRHARHE